MFLLRRTAARAFVGAPFRAVFARPRSIATFRLITLQPRQQQWSKTLLQKRFASDEATEREAASSADAPDDFAQTGAEVPMEEDLTPAEQAAHASPTDASATVGVDALETAVDTAQRSPRRSDGFGGEETFVSPHPTLYIGNLYYEVTADQLKRVFSRFGEIESVKLIYDNRGLSRGFGYVEFKTTEDAQTAVDNLNMQVFEGRNLVVQFHRAKFNSKTSAPEGGGFTANPPSRTLFIGNMSFEMSDKDLNDLFRDIRNVMDVRVAIDRRTGQPRGFAHADFIDVASATRAKEILDEKVIYGRQLRIDYSKSGTQNMRDKKMTDNP